MKILHVTSSVDPALGGLSACIRSLTPALAALGHPSEIVCLDAPHEPYLESVGAPVHALGPGYRNYGYSPRLMAWLKAEVRRFDAVIVHGLWQYHGLAVHRALAAPGSPPYFVFSHGMLDPWFKREYPLKHLKKWFYWWPAERNVLRGAAAVLFTCEEERRLARESFAGSTYRERVVAFGTAAPPDNPARQREAFFARMPELREAAPTGFFSDASIRKKAWTCSSMRMPASPRGNAALPRLVMAGPCADADYLRQLQTRHAGLEPANAVLWPGMLQDDVKWGALRAAEAFVLPSHQENFGIAVVEALACGTPVLISDQVNIWREITTDGAGLAEPDTAEGTLRLLSLWTEQDADTVGRMRIAARRSFVERYEIGAVARSLVTALHEALPPPARS